MSTDRAVTVPIQYVLLLATIALLSAGLFVSMGGFVETERGAAVEDTLSVIGTRLSVDIATADRLAGQLDGGGNVTVAVDLPAQVAGATYTVDIDHVGGNHSRLTLATSRPDRTVAVDVVTDVDLAPGTVAGGDVVIVYGSTGPRLEVQNA